VPHFIILSLFDKSYLMLSCLFNPFNPSGILQSKSVLERFLGSRSLCRNPFHEVLPAEEQFTSALLSQDIATQMTNDSNLKPINHIFEYLNDLLW